MSKEFMKRLLQIAEKLNDEQEKMCNGREVCAGCHWFDNLNLGASDSFLGCGQYIAAKKILAREQLIRVMLDDYEGPACEFCDYSRKDGNLCAIHQERGNDACFEGMMAWLDAENFD